MDPFDLRLWPSFKQAGGTIEAPAIIDQITVDSRRICSPNALFIALEGDSHDGHHFISQACQQGACYVIVKKGWPCQDINEKTTLLRVDHPLKALQEIAKIYRQQFSCQVIGITGSYGKTMVKDLLQSLLKKKYTVAASPESFNSQLGVPLSLLTITKHHQIALIEAGISHESEMEILNQIIQPTHCIITHIGKKHLTTLKSLNVTATEMLKLQPIQQKDHWLLLPYDPYLLKQINTHSASHHFWTTKKSTLPHADYSHEKKATSMLYHIDFPNGQHYTGSVSSGFYFFLDLLNITIKAAWLLGASFEEITETLKSYHPLPMRTEIWKSSIGTTFINDTYCSDPQSIDNSLKHLCQIASNNKIFAFGGMKGNNQHLETDYKRIGQAINTAKIDWLIVFGPHIFQPLINQLHALSPDTKISQCSSYDEAMQLLQLSIKNQDTVLIKGERKYAFDELTEKFNDSLCSNQCIINLAAIGDNINALKSCLPLSTEIMVMVKAFAYGTDEVRIAKFLKTCHINFLGVSYVDEGVALKRAGVLQSIFVINAAIYEAAKVVKWDLAVGLSDISLLQALEKEAKLQNKRLCVHLHVNTGMGRFGCRPEDALDLAKMITTSTHLYLEGIMTHFTSADDPEQDEFTIEQANNLSQIIQLIEDNGIKIKWRHAANSSGVMRFYFPQFNMVRIGLSIYGLYASSKTKEAMELRLSLSLHSRIVGINVCKQGDTISYGRSYKIKEDGQRIAVLPIGYFDGLHRHYSGKGFVMIHGQRAPMVGKICMDFMMVDITAIPQAAIGDPVLFFGEDEHGHYLSPEDLATDGDSIVHELITCLGPRIQRVFVHEEAKREH